MHEQGFNDDVDSDNDNIKIIIKYKVSMDAIYPASGPYVTMIPVLDWWA